jgi:hypothetical protein
MRHKYNAKKVRLDGFTFDSQREAAYYAELKLRERAHEISGIRIHPAFHIEIQGRPICKVILDFAYTTKDGDDVYVDVKGVDTALSKLKRKMVEAAYGIDVEVVK